MNNIYCYIEKNKRGWSVVRRFEQGGGVNDGAHNKEAAVRKCFYNIASTFQTAEVYIKGKRQTREDIKKILKNSLGVAPWDYEGKLSTRVEQYI